MKYEHFSEGSENYLKRHGTERVKAKTFEIKVFKKTIFFSKKKEMVRLDEKEGMENKNSKKFKFLEEGTITIK